MGPEGDAEATRGLLQGEGGVRGLEVTAGDPCWRDPPAHPAGLAAFLRDAWAKEPVLVASFTIGGLGA